MIPLDIKQINIRRYLNNKGIHPVKDYGHYGMYHCPYREDRNASFKVDYDKNLWYDFGAGEGGSIIDLVMKLENCSFYEAANLLERNYADGYANIHTGKYAANSFSFHRDSPSTTIQDILQITHPKLIAWVLQRKIDLSLANLYCREIHYKYKDKDRDYFAIGFRNDKGGYELSCPSEFKGCFPPKDITTIRKEKDIETCLVFEGFWDFLSYLTIQKVQKSTHDIAVLNSVANVQKAMDFLKVHKAVYTYLDNDDAGRKATEAIQSENSTVHNRSTNYAGYNDLNDYLCGKKQTQQIEPIKQVQKKQRKRGLKL
jgi:hypothetical protein